MLFNSFTFIGFFALVAILYYLAPQRWRWALLLLASYYFYSTYRVGYLLLLALATLIAYGAGALLPGRQQTRSGRTILTVAVVAEILLLALFKYFDFIVQSVEQGLRAAGIEASLPRLNDIALPPLGAVSNALGLGTPTDLILPAGLSFYVFSSISYVVDVYRKKIEPERHLGRLALYVSFFPKLLAGPIERAGPFLKELARPTRFDAFAIAAGLQLILWGLFKKVVIADRLAEFVNAGFRNPDFQSPVTLVIAVYFYAFQIYCDFSGYSDIAIGAALVLGIRLMENFRRPYFARTIAEFWSGRWHISLMQWFRDYLYIPLGGNRVSRLRWYANQMIVFLTSGLWHGANWTFVIWGGLNGFYQVVYFMVVGEKRTEPAVHRRNVVMTAGALAVLAAIAGVAGAVLPVPLAGLWTDSTVGAVIAAILLVGAALTVAEAPLIAAVALVAAALLIALFGFAFFTPLAIGLAAFAVVFALSLLHPARFVPRWLWALASALLTFHLVLFAWVFFRANSVAQAWTILTKIASSVPQLPTLFGNYNWSGSFKLSIALIVILMVIEAFDEFRNLWAWLAKRPTAIRWGFSYALLAALVVIGQWGVSEFVYMQF